MGRFVEKQRVGVKWFLVGVMVMALFDGQAAGQCELEKLVASDGAVLDFYGGSVAMTGTSGNEVIIVGSRDDDDNGVSSGSAYIYRRSGAIWVEEAKLLASDGAAGDWFGKSVSISGTPGNEIAIVGAPFDDDNGTSTGSAYIFRFNGVSWVQESKLLASDGAAFDNFASSVSISGAFSSEFAFVGAVFDDDNSTNSGSVYVFRFDGVNWVEDSKLTAFDAAAFDNFGHSVSISGTPGLEFAVVGAFFGDGVAVDSGSAYVYLYNGVGWNFFAKLTASDGAVLDRFGDSVSVSGDFGNAVIIVGALFDDDDGTDSGSVYVYRFNLLSCCWVEEAKLLASDGAAGNWFGISVSISGDVAIVGAALTGALGTDPGSAYIYFYNGVSWIEAKRLRASDGGTGDLFGTSVSISGDLAVVGSPEGTGLASESGAAYVYGGLSDCNGNGILDCSDISTGSSSDYNANLVIDECELLAYNTIGSTLHSTIDDAIRNSVNGDVIEASPLSFDDESNIDFGGRDITLLSMQDIVQTPGGLYELSNGARLETRSLYEINIGGEMRVAAGASVDVRTGVFTLDVGGRIVGRSGSYFALTAGNIQLNGDTRIEPSATLALTGAATNSGSMLMLSSTMFADALSTSGVMTFSGSTVYATGLTIDASGRLNTSGEIFSDITNNQDVFCLGDTLVVGDYFNAASGTTTVQVGTLTIVGNLTNNGVILGNVSSPPAAKSASAVASAGDGMSISGDYVAGAATSLMMPDSIWVFSVGGNFDVAINDNTNYDMRLAQLHMDGLSGATQNLEIMSLDIGASSDGLDRTLAGHYPIGTLRIGPNATTVNLVDTHDNANDGQLGCEALYVETLIVNAGATLNTSGCPVYYETLVLDGVVDDLLNLIQLPLCLADVNDDSSVNVTDLLSLLGSWGTCAAPCPPDINDDGFVNVTDLLALLGAWGVCP